MSGFNWSTSASSSGGSTILSPAGSSDYTHNYNGINYRYCGDDIISDKPFNVGSIPTNAYAKPGNFNNYLNKMYKDNREYNRGLSDYEFQVNYDLFDKMFNKIYDMYFQNQNYYTQLANSAVQRQVEDMKKAGINPILAGRYGGAQTPVLNMPVVSNFPTLKYNNQNMPAYVNEELSLYEIMINYYLKLLGYDTDIKTTGMNNATSRYVADLYNLTNKDIATMQDQTNNRRITSDELRTQATNEMNRLIAQINQDTTLTKTQKDNITKIITGNVWSPGSILYNIIFGGDFAKIVSSKH